MEYISLSKAAVLIGKSKSTILEYIRNSKLKANKNEKGVYNIVKEDLFITFASNDIERTKKQNLERHIDIAILQEKLDNLTSSFCMLANNYNAKVNLKF